LEHVAGVVRAVLDLVVRSERGRLGRRVAGTTWVSEVAESNQRQRVTCRADFLVDLQAALELALIELAERTGKRPAQRGRRGAGMSVFRLGIVHAADQQRTADCEGYQGRDRSLTSL